MEILTSINKIQNYGLPRCSITCVRCSINTEVSNSSKCQFSPLLLKGQAIKLSLFLSIWASASHFPRMSMAALRVIVLGQTFSTQPSTHHAHLQGVGVKGNCRVVCSVTLKQETEDQADIAVVAQSLLTPSVVFVYPRTLRFFFLTRNRNHILFEIFQRDVAMWLPFYKLLNKTVSSSQLCLKNNGLVHRPLRSWPQQWSCAQWPQ